MTLTRFNTTRHVAVVVVALSVVLLLPAHARAQGGTKGMLNRATGAALTTGSKAAGAPLVTSFWVNSTQQQWQFLPVYSALHQVPNPVNEEEIRSLYSFDDIDVFLHLSLPMMPAVQEVPDPQNSWFFQRWAITYVTTNAQGVWFYEVANLATGMCLSDQGLPGLGGSVVLQPCDPANTREHWAMWNDNIGRFDTGVYMLD